MADLELFGEYLVNLDEGRRHGRDEQLAGFAALAWVYGKHISGIDESNRVAQAVEAGVF